MDTDIQNSPKSPEILTINDCLDIQDPVLHSHVGRYFCDIQVHFNIGIGFSDFDFTKRV